MTSRLPSTPTVYAALLAMIHMLQAATSDLFDAHSELTLEDEPDTARLTAIRAQGTLSMVMQLLEAMVDGTETANDTSINSTKGL